MTTELRRVETFPSLSLASHSGGLPVEVSLIAQLGVGGLVGDADGHGDPFGPGVSRR